MVIDNNIIVEQLYYLCYSELEHYYESLELSDLHVLI